MKLNISKNKLFCISFLKNQDYLEHLSVNNQPLETVQHIKLIGIQLSSDLKWASHIDYICTKSSKRLYALQILKRSGVPTNDLRKMYCYFIRPVLEYDCPVWHSLLTCKLTSQVEDIQRRSVKIIHPYLSYNKDLASLKLPMLSERRESLCKSFYKTNFSSDS